MDLAKTARECKSAAAKWLLRKAMSLWFSKWRDKVILPFMRSGLFEALFCRGGKDGGPNAAQMLFQRLLIRILRTPKVFLPHYASTLRVCVTYRCNLSCKACYARGLQKELGMDDIRLEDFARLVGRLKGTGWRSIRFLGGEPTIHPHFTEMLDMCYRAGIEVSMPTNNLFPAEVGEKLASPLVRDMAVNYSAVSSLDAEQKRIFSDNLEYMSRRSIPFSFSYILDPADSEDRLTALYADMRKYKPLYIRVSLELPAFSDTHFTFMFAETRKVLFSSVYRMLQNCAKLYVPFYIYRPIPLCLFSAEQREKLEKYSRFIFFTRCPLSFITENGYGMMLTVNPDLSTFPCASVFLKGPDIFSFKNRLAVNEFYADKLHAVLAAPLADACRTCSHHKKFLDIVNANKAMVKTGFHQTQVCQGGCVNLRCHDFTGQGCGQE
jgi:organic radical activating enzyme